MYTCGVSLIVLYLMHVKMHHNVFLNIKNNKKNMVMNLEFKKINYMFESKYFFKRTDKNGGYSIHFLCLSKIRETYIFI